MKIHWQKICSNLPISPKSPHPPFIKGEKGGLRGIFCAATFLLFLCLINQTATSVYAGELLNEFQMDELTGHTLGLEANDDAFRIDFTAKVSTPISNVYFLYNVDAVKGGSTIDVYIRNASDVAVSTATSNLDAASTGIGWFKRDFTSYSGDVIAGSKYSVVFVKGGGAANKTSDSNIITCFKPQTDKVFFDGTYYTDINLAIKYSDAGVAFGSALSFTPVFIIKYANGKLQGCPYTTGHKDNITPPSEVPKGFISGTDPGTDYHTRIGGDSDMVGLEFVWNQPTKGVVDFRFCLREKTGADTSNPVKIRVVKISGEGGPETAVLVDTTTLCTGSDIPNDTWAFVGKVVPGAQFVNGSRYRVQIWAPAPAAQGDFFVQVYDTKVYDTLGDGGAGADLDPYQKTTYQGAAFYSCHSSDGGANWSHKKTRDVPFKFYTDEDVPSLAITAPSAIDDGKIFSSLSNITGTASDSPYYIEKSSGIELKIEILTGAFAAWWNGSAWLEPPAEFGAFISRADYVTDWNWSYDTTDMFAASPGGGDREYRIVVRVKDTVGNYSLNYATRTFTYDEYISPPAEKPDSKITDPSETATAFDNLYTVYGTAKDNPYEGGISLIKYSVKDLTDGYWWGGGDFAPANPRTWLNCDNPGDGSYNVDWDFNFTIINGECQNGHEYGIYTQAKDYCQQPSGKNEEVEYSTITITCDRVAPVSKSTSPLNGERRSSISEISGTAWDGESGIENTVNGVKIRVKRDDGYYLGIDGNFYATAGTESWRNISSYSFNGSTMNWTYDSSLVSWNTGRTYYINSRARDKVPHYETGFDTYTVVFDTSPPVTYVTSPADGSYQNDTGFSIAGTGCDDMDIANVKIQDLTFSATYWNWVSSFWQDSDTSECWGSATVDKSPPSYNSFDIDFDTTNFTNGSRYKVTVYAIDESTPTPNEGNITFNTFRWDTESPNIVLLKPDAGVLKNKIGSTDSPIKGTASDNFTLSEAQGACVEIWIYEHESMKYFNTGGTAFNEPSETWINCVNEGDWATWRFDIANSTNIFTDDLGADDQYDIKVRVTDNAGNQTEASLRTFTWDDNAPQRTIVNPSEGVTINYQTLICSGTYSDEHNIDYIKISIHNLTSQQWWTGAGWTPDTEPEPWPSCDVWTSSWSYTAISGNWTSGNYEIKIKAKDVVAPLDIKGFSPVRSFSFDSMPPTKNIITIPVHTNWYNASLTSYSGETEDDMSPGYASEVKLKIQDLTRGTTYWNGSSWGTSPVWNPVSGALDYWTDSAPDHTQGHQYQVTPWAKDAAGNETTGTDYVYNYDNIKPTNTITFPVEGGSYSSLTQIQGEARDYPYEIDSFDKVEITLYNKTDFDYYQGSGSSWTATLKWLSCSWDVWISTYYTRNWYYDMPSLENLDEYRIISRALDKAGNYDVILDTVNFTYDDTAPQAYITTPKHGVLADEGDFRVIQGYASAGTDEITEIKVGLQHETLGQWWDGTSAWVTQTDPIWLTPTCDLGVGPVYWRKTWGFTDAYKILAGNVKF